MIVKIRVLGAISERKCVKYIKNKILAPFSITHVKYYTSVYVHFKS